MCVPLCFCFHKIANQVDVERRRRRRIEQKKECEEQEKRNIYIAYTYITWKAPNEKINDAFMR